VASTSRIFTKQTTAERL